LKSMSWGMGFPFPAAQALARLPGRSITSGLREGGP
jgi:hypothetical protein